MEGFAQVTFDQFREFIKDLKGGFTNTNWDQNYYDKDGVLQAYEENGIAFNLYYIRGDKNLETIMYISKYL